eukprot:c197_g1_i1.p1 GENE.c197_g1_i1~~c197_g1_i1.p1  ORF type:complete len:184 (+),score=34.19 c197_g1_i1:51-602(+)
MVVLFVTCDPVGTTFTHSGSLDSPISELISECVKLFNALTALQMIAGEVVELAQDQELTQYQREILSATALSATNFLTGAGQQTAAPIALNTIVGHVGALREACNFGLNSQPHVLEPIFALIAVFESHVLLTRDPLLPAPDWLASPNVAELVFAQKLMDRRRKLTEFCGGKDSTRLRVGLKLG